MIGSYYVKIKEAHLYWGKKRKTNSRTKRENESYIHIPAAFAYLYSLKKQDYNCTLLNTNEEFVLKASGSQSKRNFPKQFQGKGDLSIVCNKVYKKFIEDKSDNALDKLIGDFLIINIVDTNSIEIEYIAKQSKEKIEKYNLINDFGIIEYTEEKDEESIFVPKDSAFRLKSLVIKKYTEKGTEELCNIDFIRNLSNNAGVPFTSLIIGSNSSGKSFILKTIAELFRLAIPEENTTRLKTKFEYDYYELSYYLNWKLIQVIVANNNLLIRENNQLIEYSDIALSLEDVKDLFPKKILAVSYMSNDKFPFSTSSNKSCYSYLGLRTTSNSIFGNSVNNKLIDNILSIIEQKRIDLFVKSMSHYIEIDSYISITFELNKKMNTDGSNIDEYLKKYSYAQYRLLNKINEAKEKINEIRNLILEIGKVSKKNKYKYQLIINEESINDSIVLDPNFKLLKNLYIIKNVELQIYKHKQEYSLADLSSGEIHVLFEFAAMFAHIQENSVILIDEPELSLHPNWQAIYISYLKEVFKSYKSCHFIIASHSPYMVSDLNENSSALIVSNVNEEGKKEYNTLDYSTYAWSVENILYNVFQVRTCRNYYFEVDLTTLLKLLSQNTRSEEEYSEIRKLYEKLSAYSLDNNDPLNQVLEATRRYLDVDEKT